MAMKLKRTTLTVFFSCLVAGALVTMVGCHRKKATPEWQAFTRHVVETYVNQTVSLPDSLPSQHPETIDSIYRAPLKIVVVVDLDCSTCLLKFDYWNQFADRLYQRKGIRIPLLFYINTCKSEKLDERMAAFTSHPWVYDRQQAFNAANGLYDPQFQALLLDADQRILLIGSPVGNDKLEKLYEQTIERRHQAARR